MFHELINEIVKELKSKESRERSRSNTAQAASEFAVRSILEGLWRDSLSFPPGESLINLRRDYYSEGPRYRDQRLNYRQVKAAFYGMIEWQS